MFILPTKEELENFKPDFTIYNACKTVDMAYVSHGLHSEVYVIFNVEGIKLLLVELGMLER